jgi:hypothetical protein
MTHSEKVLLSVLEELVEQIDCLDGIEFTKDLEPHKAEACWDYALVRARNLIRQMHRSEGLGHDLHPTL